MKRNSKFKYYRDLFVVSILCLVGAIGLQSSDREIFLFFTPLSLLIIAAVLLNNHKGDFMSLAIFLTLTFVLGMSAEILGVYTGFLFGEYSYGDALGWKLFSVPLMIGVNWIILTYSIFFCLMKKVPNRFILAFIGASAMVLFDYIMEPGAIELGFWTWTNSIIPWNNYFGWFIVSFIILALSPAAFWKAENKIAAPVLILQALFFLALILF